MKLIIEQPDGKRHYSRMARANDAPSVCSGDMKDASPLWAERLFDDAEDEWNQKLDSVVLEREQLM